MARDDASRRGRRITRKREVDAGFFGAGFFGAGFLGALVGAALAAVVVAAPGAGRAETVAVAADAELVESGLMRWLTPRFRFRTRLRIELAAAEDAAVALLREADVAALAWAQGRPAPRGGGRGARVGGAGPPPDIASERAARKLVGWLVSKAGRGAMLRFKPEAGSPFMGPTAATAAAETPEAAAGDADLGERLALRHCGRCHVVGDKTKMGIGSTPSFAALRAFPDYLARFQAFWTLAPHPVFTQVAGVTEPFDPDRPPHIAPIRLDLAEVEAIAAYVSRMTPKDLGRPIEPK